MDAIVEALMLEHRPGWVGWLRREFAASFGRDTATARMVIAVVLVTIISMSLQVPQLAFSAFFVFFVSKENRVLTTITGVGMIVGVTIAISASLFLFRFTFDYPEIRLLVIAGFVFTGMFLSRTFVVGPVGFVIGFFTALVQTITEAAPNTDVLVRNVLWLWVALVYPITLTVIINQILLPARPWVALGKVFSRRLDATAAALQRVIREGTLGGQTNPALMELATRGNSAMLTLLHFSEVLDPPLKRRHGSLCSTIYETEHLLVATGAMEFRQPICVSENDRLAAQDLLAEIRCLQKAITQVHPVLPPPAPEIPAELPQLHEVQLATRSLRESLTKELAYTPAPPPARKPLFIPDAFTNPAHIRFALKVTLAAMICYLIYSGLSWPGISTSFVTCCFVALENTGATVRKSLLRLIGCALGGLTGFLAILYLVPQMESIVSLVLLVAVFSVVAGWVSAGGERVAYAGLQAAFAFYLCLFQGFAPETNFTIVRDRVVGIFIGIVVASLVFHFIWPERAIDSLRSRYVRLLRNISRLLQLPASPDSSIEAERQKAFPIRHEIIEDMDGTLRLSELAGMEHAIIGNSPGLSPVVMEQMVARSQMVFLMSVVLLEEIKMQEWQQLDKAAQLAELDLRRAAAEQLQRIAAYVEGGPYPRPEPLHGAFVLWNTTVPTHTTNDRFRLVRRLAEQVQRIT